MASAKQDEVMLTDLPQSSAEQHLAARLISSASQWSFEWIIVIHYSRLGGERMPCVRRNALTDFSAAAFFQNADSLLVAALLVHLHPYTAKAALPNSIRYEFRR